ncbi:Glycosyltransferase, catalytic subunit of cellulose synthase and poly-beta-1,6-N-acetylglucosamine synthase [Aquimarina amphilecti]|uniref:Glycosyltransferase, catalytic subunit of cellulose synthase and poly-beta-1,6-N-acetylglucosamine synthase n=1 Tax=Aquimarina amphilecti TaxID=1038014 RepID=A0A1H7VT79_AQUAM|nr:glycosyltransferase [Aquimarina amphilecti]SEM12254.1 Glycosyltransferase, catalytic subunit of cellulose synthase and poly-beta-1,6-N-acetylglucosamine synthase [Aquimarina amphilecti]
MNISFSFIIPVYNRPNEIDELLSSMIALDYDHAYEVVIIEDGSSETSEEVIKSYSNQLQISYYQKTNTGPGDSRNFGMRKAKGNYFLILDSDVILPKNYLSKVDDFLSQNYVHCFGGPDDAHKNFSNLQKAISFSMTSYLTTGGIRGKKNTLGKFQPRSFNMGISKEAFETSQGFGNIHPGEDPDLTIRLWKLGYETALIPDAKVFHKRRISWNKFYIQVNKFGLVRPILNLWHPETSKITYWFPTLFVVYSVFSLIMTLVGYWYFIAFWILYFVIIFVNATINYKNFSIGIQSVVAVWIQFYGYGKGFLKSYYYIHILKKVPEQKFKKLFFSK